MNIKLDENLPFQLADVLRSFGHDVHTVTGEGLAGRPDEQIWNAAQAEKRLFVTQDMGFSDSRQFSPGTHFGLLVIRLREPRRRSLIARVQEVFEQGSADKWVGCFVVATEQKVRVLRPPSG